jgi:hypothetical protein
MVVVHLPPPLRSISPEFITLGHNDELQGIFDTTNYNTTAISFRNYGPISRFDHHREMADNIDLERSVIYMGFTFSCCLVEIFGDGGIIDVKQHQLASITLNKTIKLLDLRGSAAMAAGTVAALSSITERNISQAWGRYFYESPELYGEIDGLIFAGAHNGEDAIVLYERAKSKVTSAKVEVLNLNNPDLRDAILSISQSHSLIVKPY